MATLEERVAALEMSQQAPDRTEVEWQSLDERREQQDAVIDILRDTLADVAREVWSGLAPAMRARVTDLTGPLDVG